MNGPRTALRRRDDEGSIAPLFPVVVLALLMLGGLVVDGSRDLKARGTAQGYAEEAARAGATGIDPASDPLKLDTTGGATPGLARTRVADYCATVMSTDLRVSACGLDSTNPFSNADVTDPDCKAVVVDPLVVNTVVRLQIDTTLMGIVGVTTMKASGTGKARPYEGTNKDNAC